MKKLNNQRRGIALFFILCVIGLVSIIVWGMLHFMKGEVHLSENYVDATVALQLAESGVEECLFSIKSQMTEKDNVIYRLITTQDKGDIDVDLTRLAKGEGRKVEPLVKGGDVKAKVTWELNERTAQEFANQGISRDLAREGTLTINSMGVFNNSKKQVEVKKKVKAILLKGGVNGNSIGMIAPNHGLYLNTASRDSFKIEDFDFWDPWEFIIKGGKTYMKDGVTLDLPKWLMLTKMRNELEHPFLDMGIGWTGWTGGADFTETDIEYSNDPVTREYYKWQGVLTYPWWEKCSSELYSSRTKKVEEYSEKQVQAYSADVYKKIANRVIDPTDNPTSGKYFQDVTFVEAFERNKVTYSKVLPLYGWGDWRNVSNKYNKYFGNPNKAHDTSHAVEINGVTYVKGDVFLEGWVKGQSLLVVEGNVYIGGDVLTLQDVEGKSIGMVYYERLILVRFCLFVLLHTLVY